MLVQSQEKNYLEYIKMELDAEYERDVERLCRIVWNFYYYLEVVEGDQQFLMENVFCVTSKMLYI